MYRYIDIVRTDIRCCCSEYINNYIHTNTKCVLVSMNQNDVFSIWCCMIEILTSYSTVNLWGFEFNTLRCLDVVRNVSIHHDYRSFHPTSRKKAISSGSNHGTPHPKSTQWLQEIRMGGSIVLKIMTYYLLTLNRKSATLEINITVRSLIYHMHPIPLGHTYMKPSNPTLNFKHDSSDHQCQS